VNVNRIIFLDLATRIGWAHGKIGSEPQYGAYRLPSTGEDVGLFIDAFDAWIGTNFFWRFHCDDRTLVAYESPILPRQTSLQTTRKLQGLAAHLEWRAHRHGAEIREAHLQQVKLFWTGNGRADKPAMIARAVKLGYLELQAEHHDEADALAGWWFACNSIAPRFWLQFKEANGNG
jgi:crossover junction endodeoxyribonuclease RuvC